MRAAQETAIQSMQQTVLTRLLELTAEQAQALDRRDVEALIRLSEVRATLVREAGAYLPPNRAWDATLATLVTQVHRTSQRLQRDLQVTMTAIQRDLHDLAKREQFMHYLENENGERRPRHLVWKG